MFVSIIIPCFNVEAYVSECLQSVLNQSFLNFEIVCIDNNSTDKTNDILQEFKNRYPDKVLVLKELRKGAPVARNKGLSLAKGDWIQFLDADDLLLPEKIDHQIKIGLSSNNAGFIAGAYFSQAVNGDKKEISFECKDSFKAVFKTNLGITSANLFRTAVIKELGGWNELLSSSQEAELMFRLLRKGFLPLFDNTPLTIVRERASGQISQGNPKQIWLQYIRLRLEIINFLRTDQPDYFMREKEFYYQNLFSQVRTLAKFDLDSATAIFNENFEKNFVPRCQATFSIYCFLLRLLGFQRAERIKGLFDKMGS